MPHTPRRETRRTEQAAARHATIRRWTARAIALTTTHTISRTLTHWITHHLTPWLTNPDNWTH